MTNIAMENGPFIDDFPVYRWTSIIMENRKITKSLYIPSGYDYNSLPWKIIWPQSK